MIIQIIEFTPFKSLLILLVLLSIHQCFFLFTLLDGLLRIDG